jgi:putative phosphoesterase
MTKKVALISDIQGNLTAFKQVLAQIRLESVDQIICLGDVASGAQPNKVLDLLREHDVDVVKGNMDDTIVNPRRHDTQNLDIERYDDIDQWCSEQLTNADKDFIRSFRPTLLVDLVDEIQLLCFHGSPYSYNDVIDESVPDTQLTQQLDGYSEQIMAMGHMYHPYLRHFQSIQLVNPGSVGLPRKVKGKHPLIAYFALIEIIDGKININFRSVSVPAEDLERDILDSGMPHMNWFLSQWNIY